MSVLLLCQESFWKVYSSLPFLGHRFFYDMDYTKAKAFVKELYILNQKSYFEAYKHHKSVSENFQLKELEIKTIRAVSVHQLLKTLQCIRYQIEGKEFEESQTVKTLDEIINKIKDYIIEIIPEYEAAEWG